MADIHIKNCKFSNCEAGEVHVYRRGRSIFYKEISSSLGGNGTTDPAPKKKTKAEKPAEK